MKQYEYYEFDPILSFEENFFLTKVLQSYRNHAAKKEIDQPFAYINNDQQRKLLGRYHYKDKIQNLINLGYLQVQSVGTTIGGDRIIGFIPMKTEGYKRKETMHKIPPKFYAEKNSKLPKLNLSVFKQLSKVEICISRSEWRSVSNDAYNRLKSNYTGKSCPSKRVYNKKMNDMYEMMIDWNRGNVDERMSMCSVDDFGNRFHSIFSRIPKAVRRNYLSWGGVTEIDLAQSQPTILAHLLQEKIGDNSFSEFLFSGEYLYTYLGKGNKEEGRSVFNHSVFGTKVDRTFKKAFPTPAKEIQKLKYKRVSDNPTNKKYNNLCLLLQRKETFIFEKVWCDLLSNKVSFIPVHDSIIIKNKDYVQAHQIINKTLSKYLTNYVLNFK